MPLFCTSLYPNQLYWFVNVDNDAYKLYRTLYWFNIKIRIILDVYLWYNHRA
jgi:hypothetical protein